MTAPRTAAFLLIAFLVAVAERIALVAGIGWLIALALTADHSTTGTPHEL